MVFWEVIASIIVFYLLIIAVGIWAIWKSKPPLAGESESENLMLAGRDIGFIVGTFTMTATWVNGHYINGIATGVYHPSIGLIMCLAPAGYALSLIIGGLFFAGKMRAQGHVTMLDPFQKKFGGRMGGLLFIPALLGEIFWSAVIISTFSVTMNGIIGVGSTLAVILSSIIAIVYTMFGGLYAVAYTDVVKVLSIIGLWLAVPFAMMNKNVKSLSETSSKWLGSPMSSLEFATSIDSVLVLVLGGIPWQAYFQRVLSSRSAHQAQILSFLASFGCLIMALPAVLIGAVAASTDWSSSDLSTSLQIFNGTIFPEQSRYILQLVIRNLCPKWVAIVGLGAVSAIGMTSVDSSILSAASMFARNVVKSIFWKRASDKQIIWIMRISVFVIGALACLMGIGFWRYYIFWELCSDLVYVIIFPQLVCVVYLNRANTYGSLVGYIVGFFFRITAGERSIGLPTFIKYPYYDESWKTQLFPFKTFSMLMSLFSIITISIITDFMFKSGMLSKEMDRFHCVVNLEPLHPIDIIADEEDTVVKRMSIEKHPQSSQDSTGSVNLRSSIEPNQTALELISNAKQISEEERSTLTQESSDKQGSIKGDKDK